jgi:predicted nucleic acid-binding protein
MNRLVADAGYWIALLNPRDALHVRAVTLSNARARSRVITSELVLTEVLNAFASKGEALRMVGCSVVQTIRSNRNATVVPMTSVLFEQARTRYCARGDKDWGLTDCSSFLIMEEYGIVDALSADRDFVQAGFRALLLE